MKIEIIKYSEKYKKEWEEFLGHHTYASFFYSLFYKDLLEITYNIKSNYLMFYNEKDRLVGILPLFVKQRKAFISMPFYEYGGILCEKEYLQLIEEALCRKYRDSNIALKYNFNLPSKVFTKKRIGEIAFLNLEIVDEKYLQKIEHSARKNINKAISNKIEIQIIPQPHQYTDSYYKIYRQYEKTHHGSPYHPYKYYGNLFLSKNVVIAEAKKNNVILGYLLGMINMSNTSLSIVELIGDKIYWPTRFVDLLHYELILWCKNNNFKTFDFGTVRYGTQKRYKKKWKTDFYPYFIYYNNVLSYNDPDSFKYTLLRNIWKKYTPFFITDFLSFYVRRFLLQ